MVVVGVICGYFVYWTQMHETKEHKTMKQYQADFPRTENKEVFSFTSCVSSTRSFDWNLESINIWTNCQFIWSGKVYIWLSVWEFKKTMPLATMSQQAHACWSRIEILITFNITCMWTFHTNSLLHEYLFLMHVHNYMQLTINTFISDSVSFTGIIQS